MFNYKYYNRNPFKIHTKDCVCRAISTATNLQYEAVNNLLDIVSESYDCDKLCACCYNYLLEDILCYKKFDNHFKDTVKDVVLKYPRNKLIIRVDEHLTSSINGTLMDIWDCSDELVDCYWII